MSMNAALDEASSSHEHKDRMDRMYRVQRHFYDATRAYYLLGRNARIADLKPPSGGSILEIGCGTGRNLLQMSRRYRQATVYGMDISEEMLSSATQAVAREGLHHRVKLAQGDALHFTGAAFNKSTYDRVLFSYTLSMIPDWQLTLRNAVDLIAPQGELHVVDFGPCAGLPRPFKSLLYGWLRRFEVTPRLDLPEAAVQLAGSGGMTCQTSFSHRGYAQHLILRKE